MMYSSDDPENVGKLPPVIEVMILPADTPDTRKIGWVIEERIGEAVISQSVLNVAMGRKKIKCVIVE